MSRRDDNVAVFLDTQKLYSTNAALKEAVKRSTAEQSYFAEGCRELAEFSTEKCYDSPAKIVVSKKRSFEAASAYKGKRVCVHNFASASNPGGGVTSGASAQEECLCRCSTLFPCLESDRAFKMFYKPHRDARDPLHNDDLIYTPDVVVFKSDTQNPTLLPENEWYKVDIVTCAAPNLRSMPSNRYNTGDGDRAVKLTDKALLELHIKRMKAILTACAKQGAEVVILGAFGCGAFENSPMVVAEAMRAVIPEFRNCLETIEFAVYCSPKDDSNFRAFEMKLVKL